jgi:hypothetical protein
VAVPDGGTDGIAILVFDLQPRPADAPPGPPPPQKTVKWGLCDGKTVSLYGAGAQLSVPAMCGPQWTNATARASVAMWSTVANGVPAGSASYALLQTFTPNKRRISATMLIVTSN